MKRICETCRQPKWWFLVRIRTYFCKSINQKITSTGELCGKCFRKIKSTVK